jgi:hypothetical protein
MTNPIIKQILSLTKEDLLPIVLDYINKHYYIKTSLIVTDILHYNYNIPTYVFEYDGLKYKLTQQIGWILKELKDQNKLEVYQKNNRAYIYKKITEKEVKDDGR